MPGMDRIKVSEDALRNTVNKYNTCKNQFAAAYGQMAAEVLSLNASWNGTASDAYVNTFSELIVNIRTGDASLDEAITGLQKAIDEYVGANNIIVGMLQGMTEASSPF